MRIRKLTRDCYDSPRVYKKAYSHYVEVDTFVATTGLCNRPRIGLVLLSEVLEASSLSKNPLSHQTRESVLQYGSEIHLGHSSSA